MVGSSPGALHYDTCVADIVEPWKGLEEFQSLWKMLWGINIFLRWKYHVCLPPGGTEIVGLGECFDSWCTSLAELPFAICRMRSPILCFAICAGDDQEELLHLYLQEMYGGIWQPINFFKNVWDSRTGRAAETRDQQVVFLRPGTQVGTRYVCFCHEGGLHRDSWIDRDGPLHIHTHRHAYAWQACTILTQRDWGWWRGRGQHDSMKRQAGRQTLRLALQYCWYLQISWAWLTVGHGTFDSLG